MIEEFEAQPADVAPTNDVAIVEVPVETATTPDAPSADDAPKSPDATTASAPVAFPRSEPSGVEFPSEEAAALATSPPDSVAFPASPDSSAPVAFVFPGSDSSLANSPALSGSGAGTPGVTFQNMPTPAGRSGTPDVDQDGKRRRTLSTQGMQRLARRLSVSGRRENSSSSIPTAILNTFKRENSKRDSKDSKDVKDVTIPKDGSKDNLPVREDGSLVNPATPAEGSSAKDSPNASLASNIDQPKLKKQKKKEKKRKSTAPM